MTPERFMRQMAWERAKGEMESMLVTYTSNESDSKKYREFKALMKGFVDTVEVKGLQE